MKYTAFGGLKYSQYSSNKWNPSAFPRKVDLLPEAENIEYQKSTSSCSTSAVCSTLEILQKKLSSSSQNFVEKPKEKSKYRGKNASVISSIAITEVPCFLI